ncbi:hypothetical protein BP6252_05642 [Coleophoma cylindrospora]|uniref:Phosphoglycerate mutase-like protein n=1 Tax=Coleophoma cylindrospora TaxID=1849047 RepID=A0A3D8RU55_9HELO|nr:hypothetical protein BP6252_05642 [Coleophoma cylindrospora]
MEKPNRTFSTVTGFFLQDDECVDSNKFDYKHHNFGLKPQSSQDARAPTSSWERFESTVKELNESSSEKISYKLLFIGRNGQSAQNVAEALYGKDEFYEKWAMLDGDKKLSWKNPPLTDRGIKQAKEAIFYWLLQIVKENMSIPQSYYTSPQRRALDTVKYTYSNLSETDFVATVKEDLRATNGVFTSDTRGTSSEIRAAFPNFNLEDGFADDDELWDSEQRETETEQETRTRRFMEELFDEDDQTSISITSHSGTIAALLKVIGHREFNLPPGHILPVLVRQTIS